MRKKHDYKNFKKTITIWERGCPKPKSKEPLLQYIEDFPKLSSVYEPCGSDPFLEQPLLLLLYSHRWLLFEQE
jgi:hypothetical protein